MAIFNRFTKGSFHTESFKRYSIRAIGEVVLIFTGITLSIWFSNWNEAQREKDIEIKILKELKEGLVNDSKDVLGNIEMREKAKRACFRVLAMMNSDIPYHDSLNIYFSTAYQLGVTIVKTSAYENLKSRGLNTITNDVLRMKIIDLHDLAYKTIHDSEHRHGDLFFNSLIAFNAKRFDSTNPYGVMKPVNYEALMKDHDYKYYLNVLIFYNDFELNQSRSILNDIRELVGLIEKEITNLE